MDLRRIRNTNFEEKEKKTDWASILNNEYYKKNYFFKSYNKIGCNILALLNYLVNEDGDVFFYHALGPDLACKDLLYTLRTENISETGSSSCVVAPGQASQRQVGRPLQIGAHAQRP